jgi:hypothetical protein
MRFVWLVLALTAFGCSPSRTIYLSDDEPESVMSATIDAVDFWNDAVGVAVLSVRVVARAELAHVNPLAIVVVSRGRDVVHGNGRGETAFYGGAHVVLERSAFQVGEGYLYHEGQGAELVAHELGHALGLLHHDEPGNLMKGENYAQGGTALTDWQLRRVRAVLGVTLLVAP